MLRPLPHSPDWVAPREGHDWRDDDIMLAVAWLKSFSPAQQMQARIDKAKAHLEAARAKIRCGEMAALFDPADTLAWYIFQAETFATDRVHYTPEGALAAGPIFTRLGKELTTLMSVGGVDVRAERLVMHERRQPDGALFELLVALAYRRNGWRVEFLPETPGRGRTHDLNVFRRGARWAVECKRMGSSPYATREKARGELLAQPVHEISLASYVPIVVEVSYKIELSNVPDSYLGGVVEDAIKARRWGPWNDEIAIGLVRPVNWALMRRVLAKDYVYFGTSRMIELMVGHYTHELDHSFAAKWRPAPERPSYADAVYHGSVVSWRSLSDAANQQKIRHFRRHMSDAEAQLPSDRPGVIHIGLETPTPNPAVDFRRHIENRFLSRDFQTRGSRLRWVYGNYFVPEATTRPDETWAFTETMVPYKVGRHSTRWPLPGHLLISPEVHSVQGVHWE